MTKFKSDLENLTPYPSKWQNKKTKVIRVPESLSTQILEYACQLDTNSLENKVITVTSELRGNNENSNLKEKLLILIEKINNKEAGFKGNSANKLIKELLTLIND